MSYHLPKIKHKENIMEIKTIKKLSTFVIITSLAMLAFGAIGMTINI